MIQYSRGSEWRKWDLHIHSNASDGKSSPQDIVNEAKEKGLSVIALTDHHTAKNIDDLRRLCEAEGIGLISGIEFRTEYGQKSVHLIGLFPNEHNGIQLTSESLYEEILCPLGLSRTKIISKGKEKKSSLNDEQSFKEGIFLVQVDFKKAADKIHEYGGIVVVHAGSKASGLDEEMKHYGTADKNVKELYESLGTVKEELLKQNYIDICEIRKINDSEDFYWKNFYKPSILASDAHKTVEIGSSFTWIKADPTFNGLKQILHEAERISLGETPEVLSRVDENKTKYISEIFIDTIEGKEDINDIWFKSIRIPLNNELVAIIGNKGSGKSALTDIIGLSADAEHSIYFQFLSSKKFKKRGYADRFSASLKFASGKETDIRNLLYDIVPTDVSKVQYLPQHYIETLCNEIGKVESFRKEIEKVVFQYIPDEKKLKKNSFSELIDYKKEVIDSEIRILKNQLENINGIIIGLEDKKNPEFKKSLESQKARKEEEFRVHIERKPAEEENPANSETPETKSQSEKLAHWESELQKSNDEITKLENEISTHAVKIEDLQKFKRDIENRVKEAEQFIEQNRSFAEKYSLNILTVFSIQHDLSQIDAVVNQQETENREKRERLGTSELPENSEFERLNLKAKVTFCDNEIKKIKATLSLAAKKYQTYLDNLKKWELTKKEIEGDKESAGSIEYIKNEISYLETSLQNDLSEQRRARLSIAKEIYTKKVEIKNFYDEIKLAIDNVLSSCQDQRLTINSSFSLDSDFIDSFMSYINKSRVGSFRWEKEGKKNLFREKILNSVDLNKDDSIEQFLKTIIDHLETDKREANEDNQIPTFIGDQITKRNDFYRFLFSLEYIQPHYELRQNGKSLDKLSPGEKGALLLIFYLVLDKSEIPLIIDQPEDNLDNYSVAKILVPFIKKAKKRRQIIMVTHNPNLAVVADAEQVIHVNIDKEQNNRFSFVSGSIENYEINEKIVNVLEGTMPAFKTRKRKYPE